LQCCYNAHDALRRLADRSGHLPANRYGQAIAHLPELNDISDLNIEDYLILFLNLFSNFCCMKRINLSLKIPGSFFLLSFSGILIAQEIDSLPGLDSLPTHTLAEVVITANRYGSLQIKTPEAIRVINDKSIQ